MNEAVLLAEVLLEKLGMYQKPELATIASRIGLIVREKPLEGCDGVLVRVQSQMKGGVIIRSTIPEKTKKRFTLAHEIGHYLLPSHSFREVACTGKQINCWIGDRVEREADSFAAELLLPSTLRKRFQFIPSFVKIGAIAEEFGTGFITTIRRHIDLTDLMCAMIYSVNGRAKYFHISKRFPYRVPIKELPHPESIASHLFQKPDLYELSSEICSDYWIIKDDCQYVRLFELSRYLRSFNAVVSLVWIQS